MVFYWKGSHILIIFFLFPVPLIYSTLCYTPNFMFFFSSVSKTKITHKTPMEIKRNRRKTNKNNNKIPKNQILVYQNSLNWFCVCQLVLDIGPTLKWDSSCIPHYQFGDVWLEPVQALDVPPQYFRVHIFIGPVVFGRHCFLWVIYYFEILQPCIPSSLPHRPLSHKGKILIKTSTMGLNVPKSLLLYIFSSCGSMHTYHLIQNVATVWRSEWSTDLFI